MAVGMLCRDANLRRRKMKDEDEDDEDNGNRNRNRNTKTVIVKLNSKMITMVSLSHFPRRIEIEIEIENKISNDIMIHFGYNI
jgi:hypothetical protein